MARQVQQGRGEGPSTSAAAAAAEARPATDEGGAALRPGDSESSIYTMAASYVSPPTGRAAAAPFASPRRFDVGAERASLLSGASSVYATAASLSSATNDADTAASSPRMARFSPSPPRATAAGRSTAAAPDSDGDGEYFETPV